MAEYTDVERRSGQDRRQNQLPWFKKVLFRGQRMSSRRAEDRRRLIPPDRYSLSVSMGVILVLSLSLLDAFLTLILLSQGATELNPILNYYLSHGPSVFLLVKYGLTVFSVLIILLMKDLLATRCLLSTVNLLHLFAVGFGSVIVWQCYLLSI
jgi:hypothetical protein